MSEAWLETQNVGFLMQWLICMHCDIHFRFNKDVSNSVADTYTSVTKI